LQDQAGIIIGAEVKDTLSGKTTEVYAKQVINATGPFSDSLRQMSDPSKPSIIMPSAGVTPSLTLLRGILQASHDVCAMAMVFTCPHSISEASQSATRGATLASKQGQQCQPLTFSGSNASQAICVPSAAVCSCSLQPGHVTT